MLCSSSHSTMLVASAVAADKVYIFANRSLFFSFLVVVVVVSSSCWSIELNGA